MRIYNSLTRRKEEFVPLSANEVKIDACGITLSETADKGHADPARI